MQWQLALLSVDESAWTPPRKLATAEVIFILFSALVFEAWTKADFGEGEALFEDQKLLESLPKGLPAGEPHGRRTGPKAFDARDL